MTTKRFWIGLSAILIPLLTFGAAIKWYNDAGITQKTVLTGNEILSLQDTGPNEYKWALASDVKKYMTNGVGGGGTQVWTNDGTFTWLSGFVDPNTTPTPGPPFQIRKDGSIFIGTNVNQDISVDTPKLAPFYATTFVASNEPSQFVLQTMSVNNTDWDWYTGFSVSGKADENIGSGQISLDVKTTNSTSSFRVNVDPDGYMLGGSSFNFVDKLTVDASGNMGLAGTYYGNGSGLTNLPLAPTIQSNQYFFETNVYITQNLTVQSNLTVQNINTKNLTVESNTVIQGDLYVTTNVWVTNTINTKNLTITSNITVVQGGSVTLSNLSANMLVGTDANKNLISTNITGWSLIDTNLGVTITTNANNQFYLSSTPAPVTTNVTPWVFYTRTNTFEGPTNLLDVSRGNDQYYTTVVPCSITNISNINFTNGNSIQVSIFNDSSSNITVLLPANVIQANAATGGITVTNATERIFWFKIRNGRTNVITQSF